MEIYVIRHTHVAVAPGVCYGQSDVDVSATFKEEVSQLKGKLPEHFDRIYSSDLSRCSRLAEELAYDCEIVKDSRLRELNFGVWEQNRWDDVEVDSIKRWSESFDVTAPPNEETYSDLVGRVQSWYNEVKSNSDSERILVITHAGVIRALWAILLEIPLLNSFKIPVGFGEVLILNSKFDTIIRKA